VAAVEDAGAGAGCTAVGGGAGDAAAAAAPGDADGGGAVAGDFTDCGPQASARTLAAIARTIDLIL
jgi:hypothetical protein